MGSMANGVEATTEEVWKMVQQLNNIQSTADQRKAADNWLKEYQRSKGAWSTIDQLLRAQNLDATGYFFAAQSLKSKVRYDIRQLDPPDRENLGNSLMSHIHTFRSGPLNVRTQLCLAFSAYAAEFDRGSKSDIVQNVCAALGNSSETVEVLLDLLTLLGEEAAHVQEDPYNCPPGEEHPLLVSARASALPVLNFTHQCFENVPAHDLNNRGNVVKCFTRWLRFGTVPPAQIVQSPIVQYAFTGLKETQCDKLSEASSDLLCELAYISSDLTLGQPIFQLLTSQLGLLHQYYQTAVSSDNEILARAVARVLAEMAERYVEVLKDGSTDAINMINLVIACATHPDRHVAQITYQFWYRLLKALRNEPEHRARREGALVPCLAPLLPVFAHSARYADDCDDWDKSEEDEFRNFRMESLFDAVLDISEIVSPLRSLESLLPLLAQQIEASASKAGANWREIEGLLFVIRVFARHLPLDQEAQVANVLGLYNRLPDAVPVRLMFTKLIGQLGAWLSRHPMYLGPLLDYTVQGLKLPKQQGGLAAAEALQDLCDDCAQHMASPQQLQGMLQIYGSMDALEPALQEKIVQGLGSILVRVEPSQQCGLLATLVETPVVLGATALERSDKAAALAQIVKLRTLMKGGHAAHDGRSEAESAAQREALGLAWAQCFVRVWPLLERIIVSHGNDENLMENLCRCIRSAVQVMGLNFREFLGPFCTVAVNAFLKHPLSCILYAVTTVVSAFGRYPEFVPPLTEMLAALSARTFQVPLPPGP
jgi:transportin-3